VNSFIQASALVVLVALAGCRCDIRPHIKTTPLEDMVMNLGAKGYNRTTDFNNFMIHYRAVPPSTVVIIAKYRKSTDRGELNMVIASAKEMLQTEARAHGISNITIQVEQSELEEF
jgi:hypothetical protein